MLNTILFDLDGTLAPFMQDDFIKSYFGALIKRLAPLGYAKDALVAALWKGSGAMIQNDGSNLNRDIFWKIFVEELGEQVLSIEDLLDDFYTKDFDTIRSILTYQADRLALIQSLKKKGYHVVLATNPIFPPSAVNTRLHWVSLKLEDFDYATTYDNCHYSKPNPDYYREILVNIGKTAKECLMIGNNPIDDMAALKADMDAYLVTDCMENPDNLPIETFRHGTFKDLEAFLENLPKI